MFYLPSRRLMPNRRLTRRLIALVLAVLAASVVAAYLPNPDLQGLFLRNRMVLHFMAHALVAVAILAGAALLFPRRSE